MLVITRTEHEEIVVQLPDGREIVIMVIDTLHGHKVRLGFTADMDIKIHRREVSDAIKREKAALLRKEGIAS